MLDVTFDEEDRRIRRGDGAQDFAILRRFALDVIKTEKSDKSSVCLKRLKTGWSIDYLQKRLPGLHPLRSLRLHAMALATRLSPAPVRPSSVWRILRLFPPCSIPNSRETHLEWARGLDHGGCQI